MLSDKQILIQTSAFALSCSRRILALFSPVFTKKDKTLTWINC